MNGVVVPMAWSMPFYGDWLVFFWRAHLVKCP
jgi:hypothetical protein